MTHFSKPAADAEASFNPARALYGLLVVSLGSTMGPLDASVNVAFPIITKFFSLNISDIQWIIIVYVLAQTCVTIVFGRIGDLYGHKRVFMIGTAACAVAHLLAGLAPTYTALVLFRIVQGLAIGIALSCGPAIVTFLYPPAQKRYALGLFTMLFGVGLAIGPVIGGILLELFGWPSVFWFRTPIALTALILMIWLPLTHQPPDQKPQFDLLGAFYLMAMLASFVAFISLSRRAENLILPSALLLIWICATWLFIRHESSVAQPIVTISYYKNPLFTGIQLTTVAVNFFLFVIFLLMPYLLSARGDISLFWSGVVIAIYPCGTITGGYIGGALSRTISSLAQVRIGLAITSVGLVLIGFSGTNSAVIPLALALFGTGVGLGIFQVGNLDLTTSILSASERGVAGGLVNVARLLGIVSGAAGITWLFDWLASDAGKLVAFRDTYVILGAALLLFSILVNYTIFRKVADKISR